MDSRNGEVYQLLVRAKELEASYDWNGAAGLHQTALSSIARENPDRRAEFSEFLAYALFKGAFQASHPGDFRESMKEAFEAYRIAQDLRRRTNRIEAPSLAKRCHAMMSFADYWLASDQPSKKRLITEVWSHADQTLSDLEADDNRTELGATFHQFALAATLAYCHEEDFKGRERILKVALDHGEKSIKSAESSGDSLLIAALYAISATFACSLGERYRDHQSREPLVRKSTDYWKKALGLSEEQVLIELIHAHLLSVEPPSSMFEKGDVMFHKALVPARRTKDKLQYGCALEWLAQDLSWQAWGAEDREARQAICDESLRYAREARDVFSVISHLSPIPWGDLFVDVPEAGYYANMALFEADRAMKRHYAEKGLDLVKEALALANCSGFPELLIIAHDVNDHVLISLAETEIDIEKKVILLDEAIAHRTESLRILEQYNPFSDWGRGWFRGPLGSAKLELAKLTKDSRVKEELLEEAVRYERTAIELTTKGSTTESSSDPINVNLIGLWRHKLIDGLQSLWELTHRTEYLRDAIAALEAAAESYRKAKMFSRTAECHWRIAAFLDILGEYSAASEKFELASGDFKAVAERFPGLKEFYIDHSLYMSAWHSIAKARHHHSRQEHGLAKEAYKLAAERHQSTRRWNHMSTNYLALATVEGAEDLSLKDNIRESIEAFRDAAQLFNESAKELTAGGASSDILDESQMVQRLIDSAEQRQARCKARIALEEARLLEREGNLDLASEKYGRVSEMFSKIGDDLGSEEDKKDTDLMIVLSRAWKAMAKAEADSSPELYEEAAKLFEEAKTLSFGEKAKNLAMGHSRLCMALASGARYADAGDAALHTSAVNNLEGAAKYYLKANQQTAVEYVKGSKLLFDGYDYMNRASGESDERKKTKLYSMAEKVLEASASSFEKAGQHGRKEQVLKLLAKVKEDRELAVSLVQIFTAPDIVSAVTAFSSPAASRETAEGLDRFEHADVQAILVANPKELHVGQELNLEIELVNAGRGAAQLTKLDEAVPQGFDLVTAPDKCRIEDSSLNMRGRRLDSLKTEDLKLILKSTAKGRFVIKPRILYLDESGKCKSSEPQPVTVVVKELGLSGWIRGT